MATTTTKSILNNYKKKNANNIRLLMLMGLACVTTMGWLVYSELHWRKQQQQDTNNKDGTFSFTTTTASLLSSYLSSSSRSIVHPPPTPTSSPTPSPLSIDLYRKQLMLLRNKRKQAHQDPRFAVPPLDSLLRVIAPPNKNNTRTQTRAQGRGRAPRKFEIVGDPQPLLQFAIIGFAKCGTTTLLHHLRGHDQLQSLATEVYYFHKHRPEDLVQRLHKSLGALNVPRGYKCPHDIMNKASLHYFRTLFPHTKLLIGVRHPVYWFQSLYNFRMQMFGGTFRQTVLYKDQTHIWIGPCSTRYVTTTVTNTSRTHYNNTSKTTTFSFTPPPTASAPLPTSAVTNTNMIINTDKIGDIGICTRKGNFGHFLLRLGKQHEFRRQTMTQQAAANDHSNTTATTTNASLANDDPFILTPLEYNLSNWYGEEFSYEKDYFTKPPPHKHSHPFDHPLPNPVFLFDLEQLKDTNQARHRQFQIDLAHFLEIDPDLFELENIPHLNHNHHNSSSSSNISSSSTTSRNSILYHNQATVWNASTQLEKDAAKIQICDPVHAPLRQELVRAGKASSDWIRSVFLKAPSVASSATNTYLDEVLQSHGRDPCG